ncbi:MAG: hypothetical protein AseanaTS_28410 [Candidatus Pelagadaptatus aseana]
MGEIYGVAWALIAAGLANNPLVRQTGVFDDCFELPGGIIDGVKQLLGADVGTLATEFTFAPMKIDSDPATLADLNNLGRASCDTFEAITAVNVAGSVLIKPGQSR